MNKPNKVVQEMKLRPRSQNTEYREHVLAYHMIRFMNIRYRPNKTKTKRKLDSTECHCFDSVGYNDETLSPITPVPQVSTSQFDTTSTAPDTYDSPKTPLRTKPVFVFESPPASIKTLSTRKKERLARVKQVKYYLANQLRVVTSNYASDTPTDLPLNLVFFMYHLSWPVTVYDSAAFELENIMFSKSVKLPNLNYRDEDVICFGTAGNNYIFSTITECEQEYNKNTPVTRTPPMVSKRRSTELGYDDFDFDFSIYICHEYKKNSLRGPFSLYNLITSMHERS